MKLIFCEKSDAQISGFAAVKKAFLKKKFLKLTCTDKIYKTVCGNVFENKWVSRYLTFGDFLVPKSCSSP